MAEYAVGIRQNETEYAVKAAERLQPLAELLFLYEAIETWKLQFKGEICYDY